MFGLTLDRAGAARAFALGGARVWPPEGSLSWAAADDHVTVTSARGSHIAALLRRCGSAATEWTALRYDDGSAEWAIRIPVVYFRGFDMAFRNIDDRDESTPESLERLRSLREG